MFCINDNLLIDQKKCPVCFNKSRVIDIVKTINKKSTEKVFLCECFVCKHWWINPLPKQEILSSWYKNKSNFVVPPTYNGTSQHNKYAEKIFSRLTNYLKKPNFNYLEIGCGTGNLLKYFSKKATLAYGVEPGDWNAESDLNIVQDIDLVPGNVKFDIVVLLDVLEHVSDPNAILGKISQIVNKNAIIFLEFPNKDSLKAHIMKGKWSMVLPFGHLHFFSLKSITELCKKNDLKILAKRPIRSGNTTAFDLIRNFKFSEPNIIYRLIKSLFLGQIVLGKDQWDLILTK